jgi:hypothetical protein
MLQRTSAPRTSRSPTRPLRILIEDAQLVFDDLTPPSGVEVAVCAGPDGDHDTCPLVLEGACSLGHFDAVCSALEGPWAHSVHAAWTETDTAVIDLRDHPATDAEGRLNHHVGAALQLLWAPYAPVEDD